jgi:rsbT co-antagonist protein RsbR
MQRIALLEAENNVLYQLLDAVPAMILYKGPQSRLRYANPALRTFYGLSSEQMENVIDAPLDPAEKYVQDDEYVFSSGEKLASVGELFIRSDGTAELFNTVKSPVYARDGSIIGTVGVFENATREQDMASQLSASEARFRRLMTNIPGMVFQYVQHPDGSVAFLYASDGSREICGLEPAAIEADAQALLDALHPADRQPFTASLAESAASLAAWSWEGRSQTAQGTRWIQAQARPVRHPDGSIIWDGVMLDISQRKHAELLQARFAAILDATPDFVAMATPAGETLYINPAGRTMLGIPLGADVSGLTMIDVQSSGEHQRFRNEILPGALSQGTWAGESALLARSGAEIPVSQVLLCHRSPAGLPEFLAMVARDITERKTAELEQQRLQAEIIRAQADALIELSMPLITLHKHVLLMPLIGTLDQQRTSRIVETLLAGAAEYQAHVAIVDVSGVPVIDTSVASALIQATQALRLLGAQVVITGTRPETAQTIVSLGVNLDALVTFSRLNLGLNYALKNLGMS